MSWSCIIEVDHEDGYKTEISVVEGHTYNLTPMWHRAGICEVTRDLDGRNSGELAPILAAGLVRALQFSEDFESLNPDNNWGDYDGFIKVLTRFVILAYKHPTGTIRWSG